MKKIYLFFLVLLAGAIAYVVSYSARLTTYDTIASAMKKKGAYVHLITGLDTSYPIEYDPIKNPNHLVFYAKDTTGATVKVIYKNTKPADLEKSTQLVLKGEMRDTYFHCREILLKCPSKYKDDRKRLNEDIEAMQ